MVVGRKTYSNVDRVLNFIKASSRTTGAGHAKFTYPDTVDLLEQLFQIERDNYDVEIRMRMNDGALIFYQGISRALLIQAHRHVRLLLWKREDNFEADVKYLADFQLDRGEPAHHNGYWQWRLTQEGLAHLLRYLDSLPKPNQIKPADAKSASHPRYFSVEARRAAYTEFEATGYYCPGVDRPKHKLSMMNGDRIEYDHLIPYSKMGATSLNNLRILCTACNRKKSDHIL